MIYLFIVISCAQIVRGFTFFSHKQLVYKQVALRSKSVKEALVVSLQFICFLENFF